MLICVCVADADVHYMARLHAAVIVAAPSVASYSAWCLQMLEVNRNLLREIGWCDKFAHSTRAPAWIESFNRKWRPSLIFRAFVIYISVISIKINLGSIFGHHIHDTRVAQRWEKEKDTLKAAVDALLNNGDGVAEQHTTGWCGWDEEEQNCVGQNRRVKYVLKSINGV